MANPSHDKRNVAELLGKDEAIDLLRDALEHYNRLAPGTITAREALRMTAHLVTGATPPSPSTAPEVDVHAAFEAWARDPIRAEKLPLERWPTNGAYKDTRTYIAFYGWKSGRAVLASRPAEVNDAGADPGGRTLDEQLETRMDAGSQLVVAVAQEVDDEGLPPLPAPRNLAPTIWSDTEFVPVFSAEQFRQGQRDAVAADRARREVGGKSPRESNDALIKLAKYWKLDGDWMTCKGCRRSLIASRDGEELNHGDGCKFWDQQHPWARLRELIARQPVAPEPADA